MFSKNNGIIGCMNKKSTFLVSLLIAASLASINIANAGSRPEGTSSLSQKIEAPLDCDATKLFDSGWTSRIGNDKFYWKGDVRTTEVNNLKFSPQIGMLNNGTNISFTAVYVSIGSPERFRASVDELVNKYKFNPNCTDFSEKTLRDILKENREYLRRTNNVDTTEMLDHIALYFQQRDLAESRAAERAAKIRKTQDEERNNKVAAFRAAIKEGDNTANGIVTQVRGNLVKIQLDNNQCTQRDYSGACVNWINTPVEKWFKRNEIYPQ